MPSGVKSGLSWIQSLLHIIILVSRDKGGGGIKTRSVTTSFASQLEAVFTNEIENSVFDEEVKTDVDAELDQPFARARLTYQQVIPFDPDIHPYRIMFGEVTDILGKVNTRKACGPDHITNKIIRYLLPTLHIIIQDLTNICVFHGYQHWNLEMSVGSDDL